MRVADTSFLYAIFSERDELHSRAIAEARRVRAFSVPSEILSETLALIHRRQGFEAAKMAGEWIHAQANIDICTASKSVIESTWRIFTASGGNLSYPDSTVVAYCRALDARPLTFDDAILAFERKRARA